MAFTRTIRNFYIDKTAGNTSNSGCCPDVVVAINEAGDAIRYTTNKITITGGTKTFPDVDYTGKFIRIKKDPPSAVDKNVRILSRDDATTLTVAVNEGANDYTGCTAVIGGAMAELVSVSNLPTFSQDTTWFPAATATIVINLKKAATAYSKSSALNLQGFQGGVRIHGYVTDLMDGGFTNGVFDGPTINNVTADLEGAVYLVGIKLTGTHEFTCSMASSYYYDCYLDTITINSGMFGTSNCINCYVSPNATLKGSNGIVYLTRCVFLGSTVSINQHWFTDCWIEPTSIGLTSASFFCKNCIFSSLTPLASTVYLYCVRCHFNVAQPDRTASALAFYELCSFAESGSNTNCSNPGVLQTAHPLPSWKDFINSENTGIKTKTNILLGTFNLKYPQIPDPDLKRVLHYYTGLHGLKVPDNRRYFFGITENDYGI